MDNKRDMQFFINRRTPRLSHFDRVVCPCCLGLAYRLKGIIYLCDLDSFKSTEYRVNRDFILHSCILNKIDSFELIFREKELELLTKSFSVAVCKEEVINV